MRFRSNLGSNERNEVNISGSIRLIPRTFNLKLEILTMKACTYISLKVLILDKIKISELDYTLRIK